MDGGQRIRSRENGRNFLRLFPPVQTPDILVNSRTSKTGDHVR